MMLTWQQRIKSIGKLACAIFVLATATVIQAQDDEDTQTDAAQPPQTANSAEQEKAETSDDESEFTPTEEISRDLSVSFPVDI